jgi:hypothetical protein
MGEVCALCISLCFAYSAKSQLDEVEALLEKERRTHAGLAKLVRVVVRHVVHVCVRVCALTQQHVCR